MFAIGPTGASQRVGDCVKSNFKCTLTELKQVGDDISFLKRRRMWVSDGLLGIIPSPKHVETLATLLGVTAQKPEQTPLPVGGTLPSLDPELSAVFTRCAVILLRTASDLPHVQFATKTLASFSANLNVGAWRCFRRLGNYLFYHAYVPGLQYEGKGQGLVVPSNKNHVREIFADSDWSGNRSTRKSASVGYILSNGMTVHCCNLSQTCVALSSAEAEYIACVSTTCDGILPKAVLAIYSKNLWRCICLYTAVLQEG